MAIANDLLQRSLDLPPRAMSILREVHYALYEDFGIFAGERHRWPTLFDSYQRVLEQPKLNAQAREAILDRLGSALIGLSPDVAAFHQAWKPSDLASHHIVFELRGAPENLKTLLLGYLLFSVLYQRIESGRHNAKLDLCICFDDAQRLFTASNGSGELPTTDEVAGLIRSTGTCLWGSCQSLHGLSRGLLPNLATKFMGRLGGNEDYQRLGADMGLDAKQIAWAKANLRPGLFIGQVAEGPWRSPFVFSVPEPKRTAQASDAWVQRSVHKLDALPVLPALEFSKWRPRQQVEPPSIREAPANPQVQLSPTDRELAYLKAAKEHVGLPSSRYAKLLGMSQQTALKTRRSLLSAGFLQEHEVATGGRGRSAIILELTTKGEEALEREKARGEELS